MQNCIADIRKWMLQDRLRLNDDKTEFIMIGTRQKLAKVNIYPMQSRITLGDRSFKYAGRKLWHELPRDIRYANTVHIFKRLLKPHLFRKAYLL
ncbi:hypothetical protein pdam_00024925 [Pocillopora damicornis]|uniref:Reverse transcriptase domain-containing protein n=1 Tax=Pocillopora damicornis TaxID=46731 RepID=A0A3M6TZ67_POCDA|nr:hypothetical protein pdam_00024925 [Pocillopora damicornis]